MRSSAYCAAATFAVGFAVVLSGCASPLAGRKHTLTVKWQRLVDETGNTCGRCSDTQREVRIASDILKRSLRPLNMHVVVEEMPMSPGTVAKDTSQSNRIFVDGRPLADWLGGKIGMSPCESCCPDLGPNVKCRTLTVDGNTHEAIPAALIVRAGLRAADVALAKRLPSKPCCAKGGCTKPCG
ncbi:MAG: DUF2703 domain-containing protein [Planctomycetota bacterium]